MEFIYLKCNEWDPPYLLMRDVHHWSTPLDYWRDTSFFPSRSVTGTRHIVLIIQLTNTPMLFSLSPQVVVRLRQCSSEHPPWAGLTLTPIWHIERDSGPALVQKWTDLTQCCTPHSFRAVFLSSLIISALVWSQGLSDFWIKKNVLTKGEFLNIWNGHLTFYCLQ